MIETEDLPINITSNIRTLLTEEHITQKAANNQQSESAKTSPFFSKEFPVASHALFAHSIFSAGCSYKNTGQIALYLTKQDTVTIPVKHSVNNP